jgi:MFS family permease
MPPRLTRFTRELRSHPGQFWVLTLGTFIYVGAAAVAFPFEGIYLHTYVHASLTTVGAVFGLVPLAVIPLQIWGGQLTDRLGRRRVIVFAVFMGTVWFVGFAFVTEVWQVAVLVAVESSFGWPLFQTAANAMIADLVPVETRQEAFSINRVAMNLGVVIGPALAALALALGASFRELFLAAAAGCTAMVVLMLARLRESRPASAAAPPVRGKGEAPTLGYRAVLADRAFLVFCLCAVLPVFCIGTFGSIYSIYITSDLGVSDAGWGLLLMLNALIVAVVQYPLIRATRMRNRMLLLSISSALLAVGIGGAAFAGPLWSLVALVGVMSVGETLLSPVASAEVSDLAPEAVRGRYMGVWTVVWSGGASLGPALGGRAMDVFGARQGMSLMLVVGLVGAGLFLALAPSWRRRRVRARRAVPAED